eukprot:scaffold224040_cov31-Tisochrysis_lutea.AAC.2
MKWVGARMQIGRSSHGQTDNPHRPHHERDEHVPAFQATSRRATSSPIYMHPEGAHRSIHRARGLQRVARSAAQGRRKAGRGWRSHESVRGGAFE